MGMSMKGSVKYLGDGLHEMGKIKESLGVTPRFSAGVKEEDCYLSLKEENRKKR